MSIEEFHNLLGTLTSSDNAARQQAEATYNSTKESQPVTVLTFLAQTIQCPDDNLRAFAAVLFRRSCPELWRNPAVDAATKTTIKQLLNTIARDLNYASMDTCAIFDVKDFEHPQYVREKICIYKLMQSWQAALMKGFKGKLKLKTVSSHKLVFRKRLFLSGPAEKISCPVDLHLLFSQSRQDVAFGRFAITEVEALLLASLTLQIEFGDYNPQTHQGGFLRDILQEYIPANVYSAPHPLSKFPARPVAPISTAR